ncbi:MAG TPA: hypothetical protein PLD20_10020 [Blastocatellia bacterium]|nr:hypothetical protein [Blastocatellia bacterium]HMV81885.1 hypothetical protein [Blastocatellia bacterium]HMZ18255.1 hypothetical protein [Blastocatellia bacterium]HNG33503.1 hypothetical protein [Blastocatellia bacterium]
MRKTLPQLLKPTFKAISLLIAVFAVTPNPAALAQIRTDPCEAYIERLRNTPPSDQKSGSVLFFAKYISDAVDPIHENTQIHITNTHAMNDVDVDLYFVDGSTAAVDSARLTLAPNQTTSFLASDVDPGVVGYIVAVANFTGAPITFNYLIGDAYIHEMDGQVGMLPAMAVARVSREDVRTTETSANLIFDGNEYERLPQAVVVSSFNSQTTHSTTLATFVPTTNLGFTVNDAGTITALVYDDTGRVRSTSFLMRAYRRTPLASLRISEDLNNFVKAGRTGWIKLMTTAERPLMGAVFTRGPQFNGAMNLRQASLLNSYTITVPVI